MDQMLAPTRPDPFGARATLTTGQGNTVSYYRLQALAKWKPRGASDKDVEFPFLPGRVVLQDFTGVPAVVDLAAMRSAVARMGGDVTRNKPRVPVDLVIYHSVQVDTF